VPSVLIVMAHLGRVASSLAAVQDGFSRRIAGRLVDERAALMKSAIAQMALVRPGRG
jgi:hypothetical protein